MKARERNELIISWLTISAAFAMLLSSGLPGPIQSLRNFPISFLISSIAVGTGFILHELAHKYTAMRYGAHAEFRLWNFGLMLALFTGILALFTNFRFLFAAPGAVYIYGSNISRKQNGIISLAGPLTNMLIAAVFFLLYVFFPFGLMGTIFRYGIFINIFLGLFNMLPIFPLDGSKVMAWDIRIWAVSFGSFLLLYIFL